MIIRVILFGLFFTCIFNCAMAQVPFVDRIQLIETFDDKLKKGEPAVFSITIPDTGKTNFQIQGALGITFLDLNRFSLSVYGEWHQNTLIDKIQNVRQAGLNSNFLIGNLLPGKGNFAADFSVNAKYMIDLEKKKQSVTGGVYFSPLFGSTSCWIAPDNIVPGFLHDSTVANIIQYTYTPYFGIENVHHFKAEEDSLEGNILLLHLRIVGHIYPLSGYFMDWIGQDQFIDLSIDYTFRRDIQNSTNVDPKNRQLLKVGGGFKFGKKLKRSNRKKKIEAKIGYEFVMGEDIMKGQENQQYQQVVLKLKF